MAAAWMTFVYGLIVVSTVAEGAPSSSSSSSSSSSNGGGAAYAGDGGGGGGGYGDSMAFSGNGGSMAFAGDGGGFFFPNFAFPQQQPIPYMGFPFGFNPAQQALQQQIAALAMLQAGGFPNQFAFPAGQGQGAYVNTNSLGGDGGYAAGAASNGPDDGIALRIGPGDIPTGGSDGGSFGTFSSSSSSDIGGVKRMQSTVGVNDNGKIYFKTASKP